MIFLDHASTTYMDPRVKEQLAADLARPWNASSVHQHGQAARAALENAREELAALLNLSPRQVVFTASATEANNLAIRGLLAARAGKLSVVSSRLEHSCIRETLARLALRGAVELNLLPAGPDGRVKMENMPDRFDLLCVMAVQNETGVWQPLERAKDVRWRHGALWLCDITQAAGLAEIDGSAIGADFYSLSSHKVYGPPGVGALAGPGLEAIDAQITGGPQENERRAGTQPVALIRAFVLAMRLAREELAARRAHLENLIAHFCAILQEAGLPFEVNGGEGARLPGFLSLSFPGFTGADLVIAMDARGFSVSSGAACSTGVMELSPAMEAMFPADQERAAGALRITPGKDTTLDEIGQAAAALVEIVKKGKPTGRFARRG